MPASAAAIVARPPRSEAGPSLSSSSSSPSSSASAVVVISNPQTHPSPLHPRPLIRELLRTRYAAPGAVLLVEAVDAAPTSATGRWRAVRLLLGDGELCIQALLAAELHGYVDTGEIAAGTYLRLDEFKLEHRTLPSAGGGSGNGRDRDKLKNGKEKAPKRMVCLIIDNMVPVGWNSTLISMAERWAREKEASAGSIIPRSIDVAAEKDDAQLADYPVEPSKVATALPVAAAVANAAEAVRAPHIEDIVTAVQEPREVGGGGDSLVPRLLPADDEALEAMAAARYDSEEVDEFDADDFEVMPVSQARPAQQQQQSREVTRPTSPSKLNTVMVTSVPTAPAPPPRILDSNKNSSNDTRQPTAPAHTHRPSTATPKPPIKLTLLKSIPSLPYKQNWSVNVVAVVSAVSDLEPSYLPGLYTHQRQARLADPSTPKHVLLTVFLDPEEFSPAVGSVVLLLGVKNHMFDGGSLKKYASDRPKPGGGGRGGGLARALYGEGGRGGGVATAAAGHGGSKNGEVVHGWWFENPVQFAWCDVAGLKTWWDSQQAQSCLPPE